MLWRPRPCFAASPWTALYSWFYIPGCIFLVLYSWLCIPGFIFQVSYYWFYILGFIFLALYSRLSDFTFQISDFRFQISGFRFQISNFRLLLRPEEPHKYCCFCMCVAENLIDIGVFECLLQKTLQILLFLHARCRKPCKYCCFCMFFAENLVNIAVFACFLQKPCRGNPGLACWGNPPGRETVAAL